MASTRTTRDILSTPATLPGTQIQPPSPSAAGTQTRTSPAYTPATSHPSSPGICTKSAAQQPNPTHVHFQQLGPINRNSGPFSDNLRGENKILQDLFVHTCQRSAARSLLLDPRFTSRSGQHSPLSHKHDVAIREFLFQFPRQSGSQINTPSCSYYTSGFTFAAPCGMPSTEVLGRKSL